MRTRATWPRFPRPAAIASACVAVLDAPARTVVGGGSGGRGLGEAVPKLLLSTVAVSHRAGPGNGRRYREADFPGTREHVRRLLSLPSIVAANRDDDRETFVDALHSIMKDVQ